MHDSDARNVKLESYRLVIFVLTVDNYDHSAINAIDIMILIFH